MAIASGGRALQSRQVSAVIETGDTPDTEAEKVEE